MPDRFDVIIVGAGPAGSSCAYFLARAGLRVLLLDKAVFPRDKTCGDGLVPRALPILAEMGVLEEVTQHGYRLSHLTVTAPSGRCVGFSIPHLPAAPNYALVIPRLKLDTILMQAAVKAGANFINAAHVRGLHPSADTVTVDYLWNGERISVQSPVVILATGASSALFDQLNYPTPRPHIIAARAYFKDIPDLENHFQFRFDGVVLPGYGWVFPLSPSTANIGAGFIRTGKDTHYSVRTAFERFIDSPAMRKRLTGASRVGDLKSYPIRTDFASSPVAAGRVLMIGEAAGLVNPLTGDGIDFALESGKLAAEHLLHALHQKAAAYPDEQAYDALLRHHYQNLFRFSAQVSRLSLNRFALNALVPVAAARPRLPRALVSLLLGAKPLPDRISPLKLAKGIIANR